MSYDYSERFSNWQVGGAAVQEVAPVVEESLVAPDERFSQNFYDFVMGDDLSESLYYAFTEKDWEFIWSVCPCPGWVEFASDDQIMEFLLTQCYELLRNAILNPPIPSAEQSPQAPEQIYQTCYNLYNYGKTATESLNYLIENGYDVDQVLEVLYNQYSDFWCEESEGWCCRLENLFLGREEEEFTPFGSFEDFAYQADRFGFQACSTAADMKTLYRKLARQYHPDLGGSESDMQELNAAYESATAFSFL